MEEDYEREEGDEEDEDEDGNGIGKGKRRRGAGFDATEMVRRLQQVEAKGDEEGRQKTRKEVMEEVMMKSKLYKLARQRAKEADEVEREKLDSAIGDIFKNDKTIDLLPTKKEKQMRELERIINKHSTEENEEEEETKNGAKKSQKKNDDHDDFAEEGEDDDYERFVRELRFEARVAATDRTRTPEEIAKEERERLEQLEEERTKRMLGEAVEEDEDEEGSDEDKDGKKRKKKQKRKATIASTPVLAEPGDSTALPFLLECPETHVDLLQLMAKHEDASLDEALTRIRKSNSIHLKAENRDKMIQLIEVLVEHLVYVVEKKSSKLALGEEEDDNRDYDVLVRHLFDLAHELPNNAANIFATRLYHLQRGLEIQVSKAKETKRFGGDLGFETMESGRDVTIPIGKALHKRRGWIKGEKGKRKLDAEHEEDDRAASIRGDEEMFISECRCWPSPGDVAFLKTLSHIFPVTDFRHPVVSAAQLLLGQYLSECPIRGPRDVVSAILTAQLMCDFTVSGKRFSPEIILALQGLFQQMCASPTASNGAEKTRPPPAFVTLPVLFKFRDVPFKALNFLREVPEKKNKSKDVAAVVQLRWVALGEHLTNAEEGEEELPIIPGLSNIVYGSCLALVERLVGSLSELKSLDAIFQGLLLCLKQLNGRKNTVEVMNKIEQAIDNCLRTREPLQLQPFKVRPIQTITPKIVSEKKTPPIYLKQSGQSDEDRRLVERRLKKQVKRERKGAARELRLDASFLNAHRETRRQNMAEEVRAKRRADRSFMEGQAAEFNKITKRRR